MKNFLISLAALAFFAACQNADKSGRDTVIDKRVAESTDSTTIEWIDSTSQDLGQIKEGTTVEVTYRFRNAGDHALVIANVTASCGCTIPEKPEEPILPGKEGVIKAKFNSAGRPGRNSKDISVTANTKPDPHTTLHFEVEVAQ